MLIAEDGSLQTKPRRRETLPIRLGATEWIATPASYEYRRRRRRLVSIIIVHIIRRPNSIASLRPSLGRCLSPLLRPVYRRHASSV